MSTPKFTHNGWFGFCPVKLGEIHSEVPIVSPRWWPMLPVLAVASFLAQLNIGVQSALNPYYEPCFPIRITGMRKQ